MTKRSAPAALEHRIFPLLLGAAVALCGCGGSGFSSNPANPMPTSSQGPLGREIPLAEMRRRRCGQGAPIPEGRHDGSTAYPHRCPALDDQGRGACRWIERHDFELGRCAWRPGQLPDGKNYLWYPGNPAILAGEWKVEDKAFNSSIGSDQAHAFFAWSCSRYPGNTINPATGHTGPGWECGAAGVSALYQLASRRGDIFGLSNAGPVPFVLAKDKTTIDALLKR